MDGENLIPVFGRIGSKKREEFNARGTEEHKDPMKIQEQSWGKHTNGRDQLFAGGTFLSLKGRY